MREISAKQIENAVKELFIRANKVLPADVLSCIKRSAIAESDERAKSVLSDLEENAKASVCDDIPLCQDTGMAFLYADIGQDVHITGGDFEAAVNRGVKRAYVGGRLRLSVVDPLSRVNTRTNTPAVIYTRIVKGDNIKLIAMPKGFGSENMSAIRMLNPTAGKEEIIGFVLDTVIKAGANPCPPIIVGVGIGGSFDYSAVLAKRALLRTVGKNSKKYGELEKELLERINESGIGPQGFGGKTSALWVSVEAAPTHIAGLPVAVNISCHATRHAEIIL